MSLTSKVALGSTTKDGAKKNNKAETINAHDETNTKNLFPPAKYANNDKTTPPSASKLCVNYNIQFATCQYAN